MISQELKDQIEKEALELYPIKMEPLDNSNFGECDINSFDRETWKEGATKYAEKLEEKDKAYNKLGVKFDKEVERWQERDANEVEKRRVLEGEIERLKYDLDASTKTLIETCKKQDRELAQLKGEIKQLKIQAKCDFDRINNLEDQIIENGLDETQNP